MNGKKEPHAATKKLRKSYTFFDTYTQLVSYSKPLA